MQLVQFAKDVYRLSYSINVTNFPILIIVPSFYKKISCSRKKHTEVFGVKGHESATFSSVQIRKKSCVCLCVE